MGRGYRPVPYAHLVHGGDNPLCGSCGSLEVVGPVCQNFRLHDRHEPILLRGSVLQMIKCRAHTWVYESIASWDKRSVHFTLINDRLHQALDRRRHGQIRSFRPYHYDHSTTVRTFHRAFVRAILFVLFLGGCESFTHLTDAGIACEPHSILHDRQLRRLVCADPQNRPPLRESRPRSIVLRTPHA